jgi:hypothetical protein
MSWVNGASDPQKTAQKAADTRHRAERPIPLPQLSIYSGKVVDYVPDQGLRENGRVISKRVKF